MLQRAKERRVPQRVAVALSFVVLAGIAGFFTYSLIMADEARDEAPGMRYAVEQAVAAALSDGRLAPEAMRFDPGLIAMGEEPPERYPEVVGAELRAHALAYDAGTLTFTYAGTTRAPGYCFPGSIRGERVRVEFHRC